MSHSILITKNNVVNSFSYFRVYLTWLWEYWLRLCKSGVLIINCLFSSPGLVIGELASTQIKNPDNVRECLMVMNWFVAHLTARRVAVSNLQEFYFHFHPRYLLTWDQREFETSPNLPTTFTWISKFQNVLEIKIWNESMKYPLPPNIP